MNAADDGTARRWGPTAAGFLVLLAVAALALPVSAYVVEALAAHAENWILVLYAGLMVLAGIGVGLLLRGASPRASGRRRRAATWAGIGLLAGLVGYAVWFVLLTG